MTSRLPEAAAPRILAKTNEYLDFPSVVGHETPFLDHLARDFRALGLTVERPRNLCVVELGGDGPLFLAHADRHGAVTAQDGAALYAALAVRSEKYDEAPEVSDAFAAKVGERYRGEEVFAYDRATGGRIAYGDVGGARRDEAGRLVIEVDGLPPLPPGTPIAFARALDRSEGGYVSGQLDNPATIAVLRIAAEHGLKGRIVITAEEEIGRSARHMLDWAQGGGQPPTTRLVVLDTSPFDDSAAGLAGAAVLRRRDATADFHAGAIAALEAAAREAGAPVIFKDAFIEAENAARGRRNLPLKSLGLTELGKIIALSHGAYAGATLQVPTFNYHSNQESTTPQALVSCLGTVLALDL